MGTKIERITENDELLTRISTGSTITELGHELGVSKVAIHNRLRKHDAIAYTAALIEGMKVQLAYHLSSGHTRRYRSLLAVAAQRYPDVFEFPYRTQIASDSKMPAIQDISHSVSDSKADSNSEH